MNTDTRTTDDPYVDVDPDDDLDAVPLPALEAHICAWAARLASATCAWLLAVAAFDRRRGWADLGQRSCAHWLAWCCGLSVRTGHDHIRVAHALERLPALREAFAAGRISYSKARAVSRVADPDTDEEWVAQALSCTADDLDRIVAAHLRLHPPDDHDAGRRRDRRRLWWRWDRDGMFVAHMVLSPEDGALFVKAVDAARAFLDDTTPVAYTAPPPDAAADARTPADPDQAADGQATVADAADREGDGAEGDGADGGERTAVTRERTLDADALTAVAAGFLASGPPAALADPTRYTVTVHIRDDVLAAAYTGVAHPDAADDRTTDTGRRQPAGTAHDAVPDNTADHRHAAGEPDHGAAADTAAADTADADTVPARDAGCGAAPGHDRPAPAAAPRNDAPPYPAGPPPLPAGPLAGMRCDVEPGIGLHPETVRRIACDAWLRALVVDRDGNPLDLGRRRRLATGRVRDAVYARDRGTCRYPGCGRTRWLDVHHLEHWTAHHGETEPLNLVVLCGFHHRAVHEGGTALRMDAHGAVTAHLADGRVLHAAPPMHAGAAPLARFADATDHASPHAHPHPGGLGWEAFGWIPASRHPAGAARREAAA